MNVAIVTGADTGIGLAIAERLLADGYALGYATARTDDIDAAIEALAPTTDEFRAAVRSTSGPVTDPTRR